MSGVLLRFSPLRSLRHGQKACSLQQFNNQWPLRTLQQVKSVRLKHDVHHNGARNHSGPLSGVKVLDLTRVLAGPFCTQILADYGADVIKIEHPIGGDDTRSWRTDGENKIWKPAENDMSAYFSTINRNKRSMSLNIKNEKGRELLLEMAKKSDIVVDNFIPGKMEELGIGYDVLRQINPSIIHASISGYGAQGPYAKRAGYDVIAAGEAGLLHITGEPDGPPTKPGVGLTDMCTGLYLHGAILAALHSRQQSGLGQKIDASLFETQISVLANVAMSWLNTGQEAKRWGTSHPSIVPYEAFKTKDAFLVLGATNNRQFKTLCERLGNVEIASDPRFIDNHARVRNREALKSILDKIFTAKITDDWLAVFEGSGMPYGPVNSMEKVFSHPQTLARNMIETIPHEAAISGSINLIGIPVKFSETKPSIYSKPPSLGEHTNSILQEMDITEYEMIELRAEGVL